MRFIEQALQLVAKAKEQGDPQDLEVVRIKHRIGQSPWCLPFVKHERFLGERMSKRSFKLGF